ncbi:iron complex transport system substrate-binding protein [Rhodococcus sp. OK611]|uniref:ABC transporter substrate-binding protein n=1 Tax=unclassified Rhodococcus (in: high G+C Gram-positive bacteria) TaxID=192944 RepID=UPI000BD4D358|nr:MULTISPECIES: iron-siderophore ABC transporter substrate-binding protein [unclassified Rhodococcus (in: high G+C Gram-positive bacteria)]PTR37847.1 iron complex transport system substrate-binding protein [Rhodococcus sp. OK611]SNX93278.1 iron complex transport system substrate-binding protein [Rhodococcus sp. OK270]
MRKPHLVRRVVPAALLTASAVLLAACGGSGTDDAADGIVRSTTTVAGAGVLGNDRDTENVCGPTAPVDPAGVTGTTRKVVHAAGETEIPADPQRIVVLDTDKLDTVCALGLQDRLVGAAVTGAVGSQPEYLGPTIAGVESVGTVQEPDIEKIATLKPDLILGSKFRTPELYQRLSAVAPTTFTEKVGTTWKDNLLLDGAALGRGAAARQALDDYQGAATATGNTLDSSQTQASVVRFMPGAIRIYGPDSFSGQVLADAGVQRPTFQRLEDAKDKRFAELSEEQLSNAEGDVIYVSFYGDEARGQGVEVMNGGLWQGLGAVKDKRVFTVDDEIWMTGIGVIAARGILTDLEASLNGYVN